LPRVLAAAGDAAEAADGAQARRPHGARRVPQGRSDRADQVRTQDVGRRSEDGGGSGRVRAGEGRRIAAAPAHPDLQRPRVVLFTEPTFLFLFLPVLLALYFAGGSREHGRYANWLLLVFSVIFYAKGGGAFTWLMLASIAFNYSAA